MVIRTVTAKRTALGIPAFGPTHEEKRFDWTKRQVNLLGKSSDAEVSRRLGVSTTTVAWKRRSLGIPPFRAGKRKSKIRSKLSRVQISRLGKAPDSVLSREWGLHRHQVALYRQELGIENFVQRSRNQTWTPEIVSRLGKEPDGVIANELGIPVKRVSNFRLQKGILVANPKNRSIAKSANTSRRSNSPLRKPWTASQVSKLGKVSDRVLASELGISHQAIAQVRKRLGILPFTKDKKKNKKGQAQ